LFDGRNIDSFLFSSSKEIIGESAMTGTPPFTPVHPSRHADLIICPTSPVWTTESLLPRDECPATPRDIDATRAEMQRWLTDDSLQAWRHNRLAMILSRLPEEAPNGPVIDYGTFFGETASALKERWPEADIVAMDADVAFTTVVEERGLGLRTAVTFPGTLQFPEGTAAMIVLADTAEHLYHEGWMQVITDAYVALRPGGVFINHCPIADGFAGKNVQEVVIQHMMDLHHPSIKSTAYIEQTLIEVGFVNVTSIMCPENTPYGFAQATKG